ncbi:MAG TPA: GNAT family N-acetyltransferase [Planctomycetota bacterium]|nr:GNAT family N-acetyltransferase [Planctomycetota bacterium]
MESLPEGEGTPVAYAPPLPVFAREPLTPELVAEVVPLLISHYEEVSSDKDIKLDPRWDRYFDMQESGALVVYTSRLGGRLIGYNAFLVDLHLHYATMLLGSNDVIFIDPVERGFGRQLIQWCMEQLRELGCQLNAYHVKLSHDWSHILAEMGFEAREVIWVKRLDK